MVPPASFRAVVVGLSNRRMDDAVGDRIIALVREHYNDFGPTLAAEYLAERHDNRISRDTLRKLMIEARIRRDRMARRLRLIGSTIGGIAEES